tara:strand:- start:256 stop:756 length:501 start_codon:yes stop_codon:yes gene_type:complete
MTTTSKVFNPDLLLVNNTEDPSFLSISYDKKPLYISSHKCYVPFGLDKYKNMYTMKLEGAPIGYVHKIEKIIQDKVNEYVENLKFEIHSQVKPKRYPFKPQLIVKLPQNSNKFTMDIVNKKGEYMTYVDLKPRIYIETSLYIRTLWLKNGKIYYKWNCGNITVYDN